MSKLTELDDYDRGAADVLDCVLEVMREGPFHRRVSGHFVLAVIEKAREAIINQTERKK